jgi:hypothetical protein
MWNKYNVQKQLNKYRKVQLRFLALLEMTIIRKC